MDIHKIKLLPVLKILYGFVFIIVTVATVKQFIQLRDLDYYAFDVVRFAVSIVIKAVLLLFFGRLLLVLEEVNFIKEDMGNGYAYWIETIIKDKYLEKKKRD
jgi:glutaredoxin-related protein